MEENEAQPAEEPGNNFGRRASSSGLTRAQPDPDPEQTASNPGPMHFAAPVRPSDFLRKSNRPAAQQHPNSMPSVVKEIPEQIAAKVSFTRALAMRSHVPAVGVAVEKLTGRIGVGERSVFLQLSADW